jgi:von Willebrand factor type A domain
VKYLCLLAIGLCLAVDGQAQVSPPTFRTGVDLVALNVVVTDSKDKYITGLAQADFSVFEDGVQQDVSFFGSSDVPLDLAILLDTSASMTDKLETAQKAAMGLVATLRAGDRVSVIDIKDGTRILFPMSDDAEDARQAILAATARGGTALYNGTTSKNPRLDGSYRSVIVRVDEKPGVRTRTRNGYLAARSQ